MSALQKVLKAFRLEMKRLLYETALFYSKETALDPHMERGTKGLQKRLYLMLLEHPYSLNKNSPASKNQHCLYTRKGPAKRLWSALPLDF